MTTHSTTVLTLCPECGHHGRVIIDPSERVMRGACADCGRIYIVADNRRRCEWYSKHKDHRSAGRPHMVSDYEPAFGTISRSCECGR